MSPGPVLQISTQIWSVSLAPMTTSSGLVKRIACISLRPKMLNRRMTISSIIPFCVSFQSSCLDSCGILTKSILSFYLMSPEGQFVDAFGRSFGKDIVVDKVDGYMKEYESGKRWQNEQ
jgi:hypothetical protein